VASRAGRHQEAFIARRREAEHDFAESDDRLRRHERRPISIGTSAACATASSANAPSIDGNPSNSSSVDAGGRAAIEIIGTHLRTSVRQLCRKRVRVQENRLLERSNSRH
jgi:hypothetical protein